MRKKILIIVGVPIVCLATLCVVIAMQPSEFAIERATTIDAAPAEVFSHVNDLQAWDGWSPWIDLDPHAQTTISDPSSGKGAKFSWNGNDQVGEGTLTILDSHPDDLVDVEQEFVRPFAGTARMKFSFTPQGSGTKVTWRMEGANGFIGKAVCLFMDLDATLGKNFDLGLASLKARVEKDADEAPDASR